MAALRHGAYSPRKVEPLAAALVESAQGQVSYLGDPAYATALWAWARVEARVQLVDEYLTDRGLFDTKGRPLPAVDTLRSFERLAAELRSRLGLDPRSRAKLERDLSAGARDRLSITEEVAEGRRLRLEAEARNDM